MRFVPWFFIAASVAAIATIPAVRAQNAPLDEPITTEERRHGYRAHTLLAKPRPGANPEAAETAHAARLVAVHQRLGGIRTLSVDNGVDLLATMDRLRASGAYEYVEPDYLRFPTAVPDDPRYASDQWSLNNTGQAGGKIGADISAVAAWEMQREAPDVIVAIIDTGLNVNHPDIAANVWKNMAELNGHPATDDDGDGYIDDLFGINARVAKTSFSAGDPSDFDGHGTHVAGIIGAVGNNGVGISGVAWKVQIMPLRFMRTTGGTVSAEIACIDYAIAKKANIINASYGSSTFSQTEFDAIKRARDAGIIMVAAAGNDSQEINELPNYPAAYALDNIVAVASTTRDDKLASYSTYGSGSVELAAPGSSILSLGYASAAPYVVMSGTSMATPHVTGALALLKQKFPNDNYRGLINRLLSSVDQISDLNHHVQTNGRLNLARALSTTDSRPFNDDFARRAVVTGEFNTIRGSNQFATAEPAEPVHAGAASATGSLWWSWTAPDDAATATLTTAGSDFDTVLAVYSGTSIANLKAIASSDDVSADITTSSVTFSVTPGATYAIAVAGKNGASGTVSLMLTTTPVNDAFANARVLTGASISLPANNGGATAETGEPKPKTARGTAIGKGYSLWYKWTAPASRHYQISATQDVIDPVVTVYTGTTLATLAEVAHNDDASAMLYHYDSLVDIAAIAGGTYYIQVDAASGKGGRFKLNISDADWQSLTVLPIDASPAVGPDGAIYVADDFGFMWALRSDNSEKWEWYPPDLLYDPIDGGGVAMADDGTVYFGADSGYLYAVGTDGKQKWKFVTQDFIWTAPAIGVDGTIYVQSADDNLYAINPDGTQKWRVAVPGETYSSPVIGADGTIYVAASGDKALYAMNPDGTRKWRVDLGGTIYASPAIGTDGTLYLGNYDGRFYAIASDGTERWHFDTGSPLSCSAVIDTRGVVYFGSYDAKLYALDAATGAKKWTYATGDRIHATCPLIADDGAIYIGSDDGFVHAVNPDGTLRRTYATGGPISAAPALSAGRLYVASWDAKVYAFEVGANLAHSPWPMARHNLRRLGRAFDLPGVPTISRQPAGATANAGAAIALTVAASVPSGALSYQWRVNNVAIPGATNATLTLASAQASDVGSYSVVVSGPGGAVLSTSAAVAVNAASTANARLVNLAVRTSAGTGDKLLFVGFAIGGGGTNGPKQLLIRGVGPTLATYGVTGALADPKLQVFSGTTLLAENDNWNGDAAIAAAAPAVGAFPFATASSKDSALLFTRVAGTYSAQISSTDGGSGVALAEIYDATPASSFTASTPRLVNISARTQVGTGGNVLIAGFAIAGTSSKTVLIRAIGPTLGTFGVGGVLADPKLDLFRSDSTTPISTNDNWGAAPNAAQVATTSGSVGAFALALESKDAVLLVSLQPGTYTAQVSGVNNTTGAALVEIYEVP